MLSHGFSVSITSEKQSQLKLFEANTNSCALHCIGTPELGVPSVEGRLSEIMPYAPQSHLRDSQSMPDPGGN